MIEKKKKEFRNGTQMGRDQHTKIKRTINIYIQIYMGIIDV